ncbi:MAG: N-acetylmuramoyl-L-alanine amidase [Alphaproteobacteria bacterium]|nr:N-acetylmuramoyl-L-alanine amidase [Alphaproteobacteria bacterium]
MKIIHTPSPNFNARPSDISLTNRAAPPCNPTDVLPAKAGIQSNFQIDPRLRGEDNKGQINEKSASHGEIDAIIIHYTDMESAEAALAWLTNPVSKVSAHYLIDEDGRIYQIVNEEHRAWHAGESYWQGRTNLNNCSIGIELANTGHSHGYKPFPEAQIHSLIELCREIKERWSIPSNRILGHSDIAPGRKQDPGHLFPWERLAREGLGLWPGEDDELLVNYPPSVIPESPKGASGTQEKTCNVTNASWVPASAGMTPILLSAIGYDITSSQHALLAFQRHFQPHKVDGVADQETYALLKKII